MTEFTKILDRIDISRIAAYFLYGSESTSSITDSYEERISASYKEVYAKLETLFPTADKTDPALQDAISDLALTHSDVYLQVGVLIGFQLYKVLEKEYHSPKAAGIDKVIKNYITSAGKNRKDRQDEDCLLENFFEFRKCHSLEKMLACNEEYQNASRKCEEEVEKLGRQNLNDEQRSAVDKAISAANAAGAEYGAAAYQQGFDDARRLFMELFQ